MLFPLAGLAVVACKMQGLCDEAGRDSNECRDLAPAHRRIRAMGYATDTAIDPPLSRSAYFPKSSALSIAVGIIVG